MCIVIDFFFIGKAYEIFFCKLLLAGLFSMFYVYLCWKLRFAGDDVFYLCRSGLWWDRSHD